MTNFFKPEDVEYELKAGFTGQLATEIGPPKAEYGEPVQMISIAKANAKIDLELGNEYNVVMFFKEQLAKEREESEKMRGHFEVCNAEDIVSLHTVNVRLRAALQKIVDGPGNHMAGWKQTWAHEFALAALEPTQ